jgi:hypothetical protein
VSGINRALATDSHRSSRAGDTGTEDEAPAPVHP